MNYNALASRASRLVKRYNQRGTNIKAILKRNGAIDPLTGDFDAGATTEFTINAVSINWNENQIDGQMIQHGDIKLIIDNVTQQVQVGDYVVMDGEQYTVTQPIIIHNPGGVFLLQECNIRR